MGGRKESPGARTEDGVSSCAMTQTIRPRCTFVTPDDERLLHRALGTKRRHVDDVSASYGLDVVQVDR